MAASTHLTRGVYAAGRPDVGEHGRWMAACSPAGRRRCSATTVRLPCGASVAPSRRRPGSRRHAVVPRGKPKLRAGIRAHRRHEHAAPGRARSGRYPGHPSRRDPGRPRQLQHPGRSAGSGGQRGGPPEAGQPRATARSDRGAAPSWPGSRGCAGCSRGRRSPSPPPSSSDASCRSSVRPACRFPQTQAWLDGYRVDFYWPELGLVVETDSLRYHRTPFKQASDKRRGQRPCGFRPDRAPLHPRPDLRRTRLRASDLGEGGAAGR